jgi:hypothetical protein
VKSIGRTAWLIFALPAAAVADDGGWQDSFPIAQYTLATTGGNPYWSLQPGHFVVLGNLEPDGSEFVVIRALDETELVDGVETRVIEEREYEDGELREVSRNFFAAAKETNDVYYFGEDVDYYKDGEIRGHGGAWRAGTDTARPGLYMPGRPAAGMKYYMEYAPDAALDRAQIIDTSADVETPKGAFANCLLITETSPLEPDDESYKRYAPGVGMIYDDGLQLLRYGERFRHERFVEFRIPQEQMPAVPAGVLGKLHPNGDVREVKVELHEDRARYAIEIFIDEKQWDVEVTESGEVLRDKPE